MIVGNGGVKNTKTYEESEELNGYVVNLQEFEKALRRAVKDGSIVIDGTDILDFEDKEFRL